MNNALVFILLLLTFTFQLNSTAFAEQAEECTANTENYNAEGLQKRQAVFITGKTVKKVLPSKLDKYAFIDEAELKNKTQVIYWTGGCAHVGYSFTFKGKAIKAVHNGKTKLNRAETYLKNLDLVKDEERNLLLKALAEAKNQKKLTGTSPGQFTLPCGDATCALTDRGNGEITIAYDFAL